MGIKKADFLATNDDFGKGSMQEFTKMLKAEGVTIGASETMGEDATDLSAQLAKIKASGGDTIFVTTDVKQLTLILKQAKDQQVTARIITTGGSVSPDQLIEQAGDAANGSYHLVFFTPWFPDAVKNPEAARAFMDAWKGAKLDVGGLTEGFRGWDGIYTIAAALKDAGKGGLGVDHQGVVGRPCEGRQRRHRLHQAGTGRQGERPERAQRLSGQDRRRQGCEGIEVRTEPSPPPWPDEGRAAGLAGPGAQSANRSG